MAAPELLRAVLKSQPHLLEERTEKLWLNLVRCILEEVRMFGRIEREGTVCDFFPSFRFLLRKLKLCSHSFRMQRTGRWKINGSIFQSTMKRMAEPSYSKASCRRNATSLSGRSSTTSSRYKRFRVGIQRTISPLALLMTSFCQSLARLILLLVISLVSWIVFGILTSVLQYLNEDMAMALIYMITGAKDKSVYLVRREYI